MRNVIGILVGAILLLYAAGLEAQSLLDNEFYKNAVAQKQQSEEQVSKRSNQECFRRQALSYSGTPRGPMVQSTHAGQGCNSAITCFPSLHQPHLGRVLPQSIVDPIRMIVAEVFTNQPS